MRANRAFQLIITREGREPAFLADPRRLDRVELVSVETGEVVLYWELPPRDASKLAKQLREELVTLEIEEFRRAWGLP